jgi:hypothetical protein
MGIRAGPSARQFARKSLAGWPCRPDELNARRSRLARRLARTNSGTA